MTTTGDRPVVLENGDRLTRAEFHRRYSLRPDIKKAELIGGMVFVASPVRAREHGLPHSLIGAWLQVFAAGVPGALVATEATVFLSEDDEVQPDAFLFRVPPVWPGGARLLDDGYVHGAPDIVCEVAASSASYDLHDKRRAYERAGVPEYVVWRTLDQALDWFRLESGSYRLVPPDAAGVIESATFPNLRLDVPALLRGDAAAVLRAVMPGGPAVEERPR
jgi:Uma2 family endonuclease